MKRNSINPNACSEDSKKRKMNQLESSESSSQFSIENTQLEIVHLFDFHTDEEFSTNHIMEKFHYKMRSRPLVPFSLNFELIQTFGTEAGGFMDYGDTKNFIVHACYATISHKLNLVLICDPYFIRGRILTFDLITRQFSKSIYLNSPRCMCIEKITPANRSLHNEEYLIVSCKDGLFKFDVKCLLETYSQKKSLIWKNDYYKHPNIISSMDIMYASSKHRQDDNWIFMCNLSMDECVVDILNARTGQCISKISDFSHPPHGIAVSNSERFVAVVESKGSSIRIFENSEKPTSMNQRDLPMTNHHCEWKYVREISFNEDMFQGCYIQRLLAYDEVSKNLIVCDNCRHLLSVYNAVGGHLVKAHQTTDTRSVFSFSEYSLPHAICLNEYTGELLVGNMEKGQIQIFK
ncbi:hypothetical protein C9374_011310 [Naegleria lovaniensis]|uniref:Uncharacterized protein n=1 Tax=Naegleria lovaniensis TaxID=51637 RepID=A0AA88GX46_NAELO|nr:uncharacterized protein C9374_011310 [Naegleria lovaniensis]KAG2392585.1 hypothetical protein C9374_011310 [Naegleria lovaniensis]